MCKTRHDREMAAAALTCDYRFYDQYRWARGMLNRFPGEDSDEDPLENPCGDPVTHVYQMTWPNGRIETFGRCFHHYIPNGVLAKETTLVEVFDVEGSHFRETVDAVLRRQLRAEKPDGRG